MKYFIKALLLSLVLWQTTSARAQKSCSYVMGLYKTANDFTDNNLCYAMDCCATGGSIQAEPFLHEGSVIIKTGKGRQNLPKKQLFGFKACGNKVYRFYHNQLFEIIDTAGFYLYAHLEHSIGKKGYAYSRQYYFSRSGHDDLRTLTIAHLIDSFPFAIKFHYALHSFAHSPGRLLDFDNDTRAYKIKTVYGASMK